MLNVARLVFVDVQDANSQALNTGLHVCIAQVQTVSTYDILVNLLGSYIAYAGYSHG